MNPTNYLLQFGIDILIRKAAPADAPVIADFNLRLARETEDLALDEARVRQGVRAILQDPAKGLYFLAEIDGTLAGQVMITYEWSDWRNGNLWWLQSVYVKEEFRGRGVFRALFTYLRDLAQKDAGVAGIRLYMHAANDRARRSYEALGMSQTNYVVFELVSSDAAGSG
ncbi:MAG TPA: GNAT family N-acetyltransferase [Verrucomicrobiae bacterium]